ncbi:unnamed protein product [Chrysoparadoxa australica]
MPHPPPSHPQLATQYTPCAGCSAAVKSLLEKPINTLRLLNAVMEDVDDEGGKCIGASTDEEEAKCTLTHGCMKLRRQYVQNPKRLEQLLDSFALKGIMKKVQPKGMSLRCETHRRNAGLSHNDNWDWEDSWERMPANLRERVAVIDVYTLEAAMHQATATHRFCSDCKHNVVTAFDILTCKYDLSDIENDDEFNPELFWPFAGRVQATGANGVRTLSCPLEEVDELICWHEDFDSREYTRSSQRHAATLEHGQREIRSIVGSVLLNQMRSTWHNHLAQVQGEQYLFSLVLHAIKTQMAGGDGIGQSMAGAASYGSGCKACNVRLPDVVAMELLNEEEEGEKKKSKSKKKKERKARAKARKAAEAEEVDGDEHGQQDDDDDLSQSQPVCSSSESGSGAPHEHSHGHVHGHGNLVGAGAGAGASQPAVKTNGKKTSKHGAGTTGTSSKVKDNDKHPCGHEDDGAPSGTNAVKTKCDSKSAHGSGSQPASSTSTAEVGVPDSDSLREKLMADPMLSGGGSLLSMLDRNDGMGDDEDCIDEALMREMEQLKLAKKNGNNNDKASRAALRSNLQKNFDQLLSGNQH